MSFLSRQATQIIEDLSPNELTRQQTVRFTPRKQSEVSIADEEEEDEEEWADRPVLIMPYKGKLVPLSDVSDVSDISDEELDLAPGNGTKRKTMVSLDDDVEVQTVTTEVKKQKKNYVQQVMRWCVTINNPDVSGDEMQAVLNNCPDIKGYVFGLEKGESGTPHFQMYLEFSKKISMIGVKKVLGDDTAHCEGSKGSKLQNINYCKKDGNYWASGTCAGEEAKRAGQGKRSDLDKFAKMIWEEGGVTEDVEEEYLGYVIRYGKMAREALAHSNLQKAKALELEYWREQVRLDKEGKASKGQEAVDMVFLFGPSAVGKTTWAQKDCVEKYDELPYIKDGNKEWFDGYTNQAGIIIDEWRKNSGSIESINQFTRKGATQVEYKGGYTTLLAKKFYFTSNRHPLDIFETVPEEGRYRALVRRFKEVHWWNDAKELTILKNPHGLMGDEKEEAEEEWKKFWYRIRATTVRRIEYEGNDRNAPRFTLVTEAADENLYFTW